MKRPIIFHRVWEMPNKNTFQIKYIKDLIYRYITPEMNGLDPFANTNKIANITNDLDPECKADYCMDALEFLKLFPDNSQDYILFDPPYSSRQVSESYRKLGKTVNMGTTQSKFWRLLKDEIARILKIGGFCFSFGWNSVGIGIKNGFELKEILMVCHGGAHNDTICLVEKKVKNKKQIIKTQETVLFEVKP